MDGKGRASMDAPRRVKSSKVGMYLNSSKDSRGTPAKPSNCTRLWDPDWNSFGSSRNHISAVPDDASMALALSQNVKAYDELLYCYDWSKHENSNCGKSSSNASSNMYQSLSKSGGSN